MKVVTHIKSLMGIFTLAYFVNSQKFHCKNPNNNYGYCYSIYECPSLLKVVQRFTLSNTERQFLRESQCTNGYGRAPHVCCTKDENYQNEMMITTTSPSITTMPTVESKTSPSQTGNGLGNVVPEPPYCGTQSLSDKIYNGNNTALDEYPWMALLEYVNRSGRRSLNCGGSLINQRYVLTAAHCVVGEIEKQVGRLTTVRLGEYNISSDIDCVNDDCNTGPLYLGIEQTITHPKFNPTSVARHHDIALLRLDTDVNYTDFVQPICLPLAETRMDLNAGDLLTVSGWGRTLLARQSNIKQHIILPLVDHEECIRKFQSRRISLIDGQICAGGEFARDSCDGDSGGPLMRRYRESSRWYLEGIVSFGNRCGLEGWPGVYTYVADYVNWIRENLKP